MPTKKAKVLKPRHKIPVNVRELDLAAHTGLRAEDFAASFADKLKYRLVKSPGTATAYDRFLAISFAIRDRLVENWVKTHRTYHEQKVKRVYYLSLEFLMGRTLGNSIINLKVYDNVAHAMDKLSLNL